MCRVILTNLDKKLKKSPIISSEQFLFFSEEKSNVLSENGTHVFLDGYVLPRKKCNYSDSNQNQNRFILNLYKKYGTEFIEYIKGHFLIIIITDKNFHVYTDRNGMKKTFYWKQGNKFFITSHLDEILNLLKPEISIENLGLHSIFHHFVDGKTMFKDIFYVKNAACISFNKDYLDISQYWSYSKLLDLPAQDYAFNDFADYLVNLTTKYLAFCSKDTITMTLTGGMDSRIILGSLLKNNTKPNAFTFGQKNSADVVISKKIAKDLDINYHNYNYPSPDANWYYQLSKQIAEKYAGMVHIHRSHRLDAMRREKNNFPNTKAIFLGAMGGEGIRGLHYDDLIVTSFIRRYFENNEEIKNLVPEYLDKYFFKKEQVNINKIIETISKLSFMKNNYKENQFFVLYDLVASLHDYQDITMYYDNFKYVFTPFMDIDYMEMLFASRNNLLHKNATSKNVIDRLNLPKFHVNVSHLISPKLSRYRYANNFSPSEYLMGKYYYLFVRGIRRIFKKQYPPNFPYNEWFWDFIEKYLFERKENNIVNEYFNLSASIDRFSIDKQYIKEGFWHKYSNLVMYQLIFETIK